METTCSGPYVRDSPLRVLVIDDNRDSADTLAAYLTLDGHRVVVAYEVNHALILVSSVRPNVVLLDLSLPLVNGYEILSRLRAREESMNSLIIAVTGHGQLSDRSKTKEAGFDLHLLKPVNCKELAAFLSGRQNDLIINEYGGDSGSERVSRFVKCERAESPK